MGQPSKYIPEWVLRGLETAAVNTAKHRSLRYYYRLHLATPPWLDEEHRRAFAAINRECRRRRARGEEVVRDHIVPISGRYVCGLHVPWNIQLVTERENIEKSNHTWPDMPLQQVDMFPGRPAPRQKELPV